MLPLRELGNKLCVAIVSKLSCKFCRHRTAGLKESQDGFESGKFLPKCRSRATHKV